MKKLLISLLALIGVLTPVKAEEKEIEEYEIAVDTDVPIYSDL